MLPRHAVALSCLRMRLPRAAPLVMIRAVFAVALSAVLAGGLSSCATAPQRAPAQTAPITPALPAAAAHGWHALGEVHSVAVLLPLSGPLAVAAAPVRDGLIAQWLDTPLPRPALSFIDTQGNPAGAVNAYREAVDAHADAVIGPLGRDEVDALLADPARITLPTLLLNRGPRALPDNVMAYALSPEDEGETVATAMRRAGVTRALLLRGDDDSLRRASAAFTAQFVLEGGRVTTTLDLRGKTLPTDAALAAARAAGADGVFLALRGPAARAVAAPLANAGFAALPRFATSQLSFGSARSSQDVVLDGILFPTDVRDSALAARVAALPSTRGGGTRLFAFGADAWRLFAAAPALQAPGSARINGSTGTLWLAADHHVERDPAWATFRNGLRSPAVPPVAAASTP